MTSLRLSRPTSAWAAAVAVAALGSALPVTGASAATAPSGSVAISAAAKDPGTKALRGAKINVSAVRPASASRTRWTLPVSGTPTIDATSVDLDGRLRFVRGKRNVTFTALKLSLGSKPTVSGTVGKRRITILTLSGSPKRDAGARTIELKRSRASLTPAAARAVRSGLSIRRLASGRIGSATVTVRVSATAAPAPSAPGPAAPAPSVPLVPPVVTVVPPTPPVVPDPPVDPPVDPPAPDPDCWAPLWVGKTDWIACDPTTGGNLRGWITYITGGGGSVDTSSDVTSPDGRYNYRLTAGTPTFPGAGRVVVPHTGQIRYRFSTHMIDMWVENLRFDVSADRTSAKVIADAYYTPRPPAAPVPVTAPDVHVLNVDLAGARSTSPAGDATSYVLAPAELTADGRAVWGDTYAVGSAFGAFTITVPDP